MLKVKEMGPFRLQVSEIVSPNMGVNLLPY